MRLFRESYMYIKTAVKRTYIKTFLFLIVFLGISTLISFTSVKNSLAADCGEGYGDDKQPGQPDTEDICNCPGCNINHPAPYCDGFSCPSNQCNGDCGERVDGVYGSQGGVCNSNPYGNGRWCSRWRWCCVVCPGYTCDGATPTPTPGPTSPPNTPGPGTNTPVPTNTSTPTVTNPPNPAPQCSVTGPLNGFVGTPANYIYTATDAFNNLSGLEGWYSPELTESWTNIFDHSFTDRGSYSTTQPWTCPAVGNYYLVCNAYDSAGLACTGNPFQLPSPWYDCGAQSSILVSCFDVAPTAPILSATWTCTGIPTPRADLSWTASTGADEYLLYRCTGAGCTPTTLITTTTLLTYQDTTIASGNTYNYRVRGHRLSDNVFSPYSNVVSVSPTCSTCDINLAGPASIAQLDTELYSVSNNTPPVGTITQVNFTSNNSAVISICDNLTVPCPLGQGAYSDSAATYNMNATAYTLNSSATLRAGVIMDGFERCNSSLSPATINPAGWWQDKEGDLVTNGDITSIITGGCVIDPICNEGLIVFDAGDYPGVPQAGGSINVGANGGVISLGYDWNSRPITYGGPTLSYTSFRNKLPSSVTPQVIAAGPVSQATLTTGGTEYPVGSGYFYYEYTGAPDLIILDGSGTVNLAGRKVILFAQSNVQIQSKIQVTNGTGVFILISSGNIVIEPTVAGPMEAPTPLPDLEGIFFAQGQFRTGSLGAGNDVPLHVRGSVIAWDRVLLERDLTDNSLTPAEFFEFGIDQVMAVPATLGERNITWKEIAP